MCESIIKAKGQTTGTEAAAFLGVSHDTALREIKTLVACGLIARSGAGKSTVYAAVV